MQGCRWRIYIALQLIQVCQGNRLDVEIQHAIVDWGIGSHRQLVASTLPFEKHPRRPRNNVQPTSTYAFPVLDKVNITMFKNDFATRVVGNRSADLNFNQAPPSERSRLAQTLFLTMLGFCLPGQVFVLFAIVHMLRESQFDVTMTFGALPLATRHDMNHSCARFVTITVAKDYRSLAHTYSLAQMRRLSRLF